MTTYIHIDETTGEQLAVVSRDRSGESQVRLAPWVLELLRACAYSARTDDIPPAITRHVFYAHHFPNPGDTERSYSVCFASEAQCDAALGSLPGLIAAATQFLDAP